jgi:Zn-dependent protease with chaperone function
VLLNSGVIALIVAAATRSVAGALAVPCIVVVAVAITLTVVRHPEQRAGFIDDDAARGYLDRVEPVVARVAAELHVAMPAARIIDDQALNAFSTGSDRDGIVAYTSGLLDELGGPADGRLLEAVTAHLVGRLACGDNGLVVFSFGLLAWILESFDVVMRVVRRLRKMGKGCVDFAFGRNTAFSGDEASFYARLLLFLFALALGIELLLAALALFVLAGLLALVAVATLKAHAWQRMRFADAVAAELSGSPDAMLAVLDRLGGQPTELARGGVLLQDLCFAGTRPLPGYVKYVPDLKLRMSWLAAGSASRRTGLLVPASSMVALAAVLGGLGLLTAKVPYGRPFGSPAGPTVPLAAAAATGGAGADSSTGQQAQQVAPSAQPEVGATGAVGTPIPAAAPAPGQTSSPATSSPGNSSSPLSSGANSPTSGPPGTSVGVSSSGNPATDGPPTSTSPTQSTPTTSSAPTGPPATPSGVVATPNGQYAITVTWANNATNATGFRVDNGCPAGSCSPGATLATTTGLTATTSFSVTPGSYQCFRVQAFNSVGSSGWSSYGCTQTPGFVVSATRAWADTGVTVQAGIRLKITATGTVNVTSANAETPAGTQSCIPASAYPGISPPFIAPTLPCWSLIARIGNGAPFEVGSSATITTTAGRLYLSVNDNNFSDNIGNWTADIKEGG